MFMFSDILYRTNSFHDIRYSFLKLKNKSSFIASYIMRRKPKPAK